MKRHDLSLPGINRRKRHIQRDRKRFSNWERDLDRNLRDRGQVFAGASVCAVSDCRDN